MFSNVGRKSFQSFFARSTRHSCSQRIRALTWRATKSEVRQVRLM